MAVIVGIIAVIIIVPLAVALVVWGIYQIIALIVIPGVLFLSYLGFAAIINWLLDRPYEPFFFVVGWIMLAFWLYIPIRIFKS